MTKYIREILFIDIYNSLMVRDIDSDRDLVEDYSCGWLSVGKAVKRNVWRAIDAFDNIHS